LNYQKELKMKTYTQPTCQCINQHLVSRETQCEICSLPIGPKAPIAPKLETYDDAYFEMLEWLNDRGAA
jgi:hypothetical protein